MSRVRDAWYVRLPSGQEIIAKSTAAVLHHVDNGTIPRTSFARRSRDEEWQQLEWHAEFTEAITGLRRPRAAPEPEKPIPPQLERPPQLDIPKEPGPLAGIAARLDPMRLRTVGVRGLMDDLIAALDSTFVPGKLFIAAIAGALIGLIWGGVPWLALKFLSLLDITPTDDGAVWTIRIISALCVVPSIIILALANALLTRMTHFELSNMRRVKLKTAMRGFAGPAVRLALAYLLVLGGTFIAMSVLEWLPQFLFNLGGRMGLPASLASVIPALISIVGVLIEVFLWLLIGLTWLLAPILVGEDYPLISGIGEWLSLVRTQFNRIVLAETLTLALGALVALPMVAPVWLATSKFPLLPHPVSTLAYGLALSGFLAFMAVANVFTYLDVKYEHGES